MNISVLKEIKTDEKRVALQPYQVKILNEMGHTVYVENNAGIYSGFSNGEYLKNGAKIVSKSEALKKGELILKVKAPEKCEYIDYRENQILFTYLHFDENIPKDEILQLIKSGFTGIAYEWVGKDGDFPLLIPMSRLTGYLFIQRAIEFLSKYKGKMAGNYEKELEGANILIIGLGTIGMSAFKYAFQNNLNITILDKHSETINERLNDRFDTKNFDYLKNYEIIRFDSKNPLNSKKELERNISKFDIILNCAVRRKDLPKSKLEYLIDKKMIKKMQKGSVVCDTTACDKDLIETCVSSSRLDHIDIIEEIIHYNCDHIPSLVANTSTKLLTNKTFKYICEIANKGLKKAIYENIELKNGVSCSKSYITHYYSAEKKNMLDFYKPIDEIIK